MDIRTIVKKTFTRAGFDLRRIRTATGQRIKASETYALMKDLGLEPRTVVDVGIANGTPELYESFPDSYFLLIEPLMEFESTMKSILNDLKGSYVLCAAGAERGELTLNVHPNHLDGSSLLRETMGSAADGYERHVPVVRIDDVVEERHLKGPFLLKVDVQGAELNVLDGCLETLTDTDAVQLEVSMFQFLTGAPVFHEVIAYMKSIGFVAYDIIFGWNRPLDSALGQVDIIFVKENGRFRQNHSYSTEAQLEKLFGR